ncbi:MAG: hypothetical protein ACREIT_03325 [Tepidisphaeraceae bacterium]
MQLQTFKASTMAEALAQVKTTMGHDAVILHTRTYQQKRWLGLKRREIVEITAGQGLHVGARNPRRAAAARARAAPRGGTPGRRPVRGSPSHARRLR